MTTFDTYDRIIGVVTGALFGAVFGSLLKVIVRWPATAGVFSKWSTMVFAMIGLLAGPFIIDIVVGLMYVLYFIAFIWVFDGYYGGHWIPDPPIETRRRPGVGLLCLVTGTALSLWLVHKFPGVAV